MKGFIGQHQIIYHRIITVVIRPMIQENEPEPGITMSNYKALLEYIMKELLPWRYFQQRFISNGFPGNNQVISV